MCDCPSTWSLDSLHEMSAQMERYQRGIDNARSFDPSDLSFAKQIDRHQSNLEESKIRVNEEFAKHVCLN